MQFLFKLLFSELEWKSGPSGSFFQGPMGWIWHFGRAPLNSEPEYDFNLFAGEDSANQATRANFSVSHFTRISSISNIRDFVFLGPLMGAPAPSKFLM